MFTAKAYKKKLLKIKALLVENGIKTQDVADRARVKRATVSVVLTGKGTSKNVEQAIADALNISHETLWGMVRKKAA